jgi:thiol:disulfide interchange protein DsbD
MNNPFKKIRRYFLVLLCLIMSGYGTADEAYLQPEQAFIFNAQLIDAQTVEVNYQIAEGYYLYRERFAFSAEGAKLGQAKMPDGKIKFDQTFNKNVETYRKEIIIRLPVESKDTFTFKAVSQGCADRGLCYAPMEALVTFNVNGNSLLSAIEAKRSNESNQSSASSIQNSPSANKPESEMGRIEASLASGQLLLILPLFFLLGIGLSFTPCVLPMVPILSFIIVGEGAQTSRKRGFVLSLAYSLGMAAVYTALGVAAGLIGEGLSASLQNPWALGSFAILMAVLSLSMFDVFQLQVPPALQLRLTQLSERQRAGKLASVFVMGAISALIVGPCVAAPLAGVLVYLSQTRDVVIGGSALFVMAIGMSVPLMLIGLSAGSLLPRAGKWMGAIKPFFGVLMLGLALWMVASLIPAVVLMLGWGILAFAYGAFLLWPNKWGITAKGFGLVFVVLGLLQLIGVAGGGRDALSPMSHLSKTVGQKPIFKRIKTIGDVEEAIRNAGGRPVMLDFYADWCVSCIEMERLTFTNPEVKAVMDRMVLIQADVTANDADDKALLKHFGLFGPPGIIFFDKNGDEVRSTRVIGYKDSDYFLEIINKI